MASLNMCAILRVKWNVRNCSKLFTVTSKFDCFPPIRHFNVPVIAPRLIPVSCIVCKSHKLHNPSPPPMTFGATNTLLSLTSSSGYCTQKSDGAPQHKLENQEKNVDHLPKNEDNSEKSQSENGKTKKDSWFTGKHAWKLGLVSLTGMGLLMCGNLMLLWGSPMRDDEGNEIPDEFSKLPKWHAYYKRATKEFIFFKKMIQEPSSGKLLPDPLKEPYYQPPYTLVLEMTGVLVHPDWTLNTGWRFKKRPGVEYFLQQVGPPLFEVVIYTREQGFTAFPIIDGLDPNGFVSYRLFRDATRYDEGHHIKDLDCLNRDLSKVILVDCDPDAYKMHRSNAVGLMKWTGNDDDRSLIDLAAFLRTIAASGVEDVRPVLQHYGQFDDPLEAFKENHRKLQEEQERKTQVSSEQNDKKSLAGGWAMSLAGRRR